MQISTALVQTSQEWVTRTTAEVKFIVMLLGKKTRHSYSALLLFSPDFSKIKIFFCRKSWVTGSFGCQEEQFVSLLIWSLICWSLQFLKDIQGNVVTGGSWATWMWMNPKQFFFSSLKCKRKLKIRKNSSQITGKKRKNPECKYSL